MLKLLNITDEPFGQMGNKYREGSLANKKLKWGQELQQKLHYLRVFQVHLYHFKTLFTWHAYLLKCKLIPFLDDLKRLIGSETTRRGLVCVFDMLQNRILNRRFTLVLFEGILKTLFPDKPIMDIVQRLHFRSNRVGKNRPFLVPNSRTSSLKVTNVPSLAGLSPRGTRKKKS